jgi:hypothetical protein
MSPLTRQLALHALAESRNLAALAEAVAFLVDDPGTSPEELLPALRHPGIVADQAAIHLHKLTQTPLGEDGQPVVSPGFWEAKLAGSAGRRKGHVKKLYVGNLGYDVTEADLTELFRQHGLVVGSAVGRDKSTGQSKGFGFVEIATDAEAQAAIASLNGQKDSRQPLTVNEPKPPPEGIKSGRRRRRH